jgi:hypothetical protein
MLERLLKRSSVFGNAILRPQPPQPGPLWQSVPAC